MANISRGVPWNQSGTGTSSASALQAGTTNGIYFVTDISVGGFGAGTWAVYGSTPTVATLLWQGNVGTNSAYFQNFQSPLPSGNGTGIRVTCNGATATYANVAGYLIYNL